MAYNILYRFSTVYSFSTASSNLCVRNYTVFVIIFLQQDSMGRHIHDMSSRICLLQYGKNMSSHTVPSRLKINHVHDLFFCFIHLSFPCQCQCQDRRKLIPANNTQMRGCVNTDLLTGQLQEQLKGPSKNNLELFYINCICVKQITPEHMTTTYMGENVELKLYFLLVS